MVVPVGLTDLLREGFLEAEEQKYKVFIRKRASGREMRKSKARIVG